VKYSSKIYAQLLVELIEEKKDSVVEKFFELLKKNGDLKKSKEIISLVGKMLLKKQGGRKIIIETARPQKIQNIATERDSVEEKVNPELIAGVKITVDDEKQLDYSLKNKLDQIFH
jgi:F0F1-type ATP synthase delta subunit